MAIPSARSFRAFGETSALQPHTVEDLFSVVNGWYSTIPLHLWVPETLTLNGDEVRNDVAAAVVVDPVSDLGLTPKGSTQEDGGKVFHFRKN